MTLYPMWSTNLNNLQLTLPKCMPMGLKVWEHGEYSKFTWFWYLIYLLLLVKILIYTCLLHFCSPIYLSRIFAIFMCLLAFSCNKITLTCQFPSFVMLYWHDSCYFSTSHSSELLLFHNYKLCHYLIITRHFINNIFLSIFFSPWLGY